MHNCLQKYFEELDASFPCSLRQRGKPAKYLDLHITGMNRYSSHITKLNVLNKIVKNLVNIYGCKYFIEYKIFLKCVI